MRAFLDEGRGEKTPLQFDFNGKRIRPPKNKVREAAVYAEVDEQTSAIQQAIVRWLEEQ